MGGQTLGGARHVLFLNWRDTRHPEGGGSEVYVERVAGELVASGHRVTVLCAAHDQAPAEEVTPAGVSMLRRGGRYSVYIRAALTYLAGWLGFGRLSRSGLGRPDVIVDVGNGIPFLSPLYSRKPVISLVHHVHREQWQVVLPGAQGRLGWWIESRVGPRIYRHCRYVAVSQATRTELIALKVDPSRVQVVHNGTPEVDPTPIARSSGPMLVVLGRLVPHKQVETALYAVAALTDELPTLELVIAGHGWWAAHLQDLAVRLGIEARVRFTGFVTEKEKHALLSEAWIALTPSLKEGWGLTIVEAGIRGTPTVAFRTAGGVTEAIVDGQTGLLADNPDDFTAKVRALLLDEPRRLAMGQAAQAHAAGFTWESAGKRFAALVSRTAIVPAQLRRTVSGDRTPVA